MKLNATKILIICNIDPWYGTRKILAQMSLSILALKDLMHRFLSSRFVIANDFESAARQL
jgi:hypothetical protein